MNIRNVEIFSVLKTSGLRVGNLKLYAHLFNEILFIIITYDQCLFQGGDRPGNTPRGKNT